MALLRLLWLNFRIGLLTELEYRSNFWVQLFQSTLAIATALGRLGIIFIHTNNLGGWSPDELLAVVGVYYIMLGMINLVIQPSMSRLMTDVRKGTLDFILTKPEDAQLLVSVRQVEVWKLIDIILGAVIIGIALVRLGDTIGLTHAILFLGMLVAGMAIIYSFLLVLSSLSFWFVRVENLLVIFQSMYEAGRWPVGIYPQWLQFALTSVVPIAFAVTVPAEALTARLTVQSFALALGLALVLLAVSRWFWNFAIKHYSGASA
jgi:ABC-2 type transport system permease protein